MSILYVKIGAGLLSVACFYIAHHVIMKDCIRLRGTFAQKACVSGKLQTHMGAWTVFTLIRGISSRSNILEDSRRSGTRGAKPERKDTAMEVQRKKEPHQIMHVGYKFISRPNLTLRAIRPSNFSLFWV